MRVDDVDIALIVARRCGDFQRDRDRLVILL